MCSEIRGYIFPARNRGYVFGNSGYTFSYPVLGCMCSETACIHSPAFDRGYIIYVQARL